MTISISRQYDYNDDEYYYLSPSFTHWEIGDSLSYQILVWASG